MTKLALKMSHFPSQMFFNEKWATVTNVINASCTLFYYVHVTIFIHICILYIAMLGIALVWICTFIVLFIEIAKTWKTFEFTDYIVSVFSLFHYSSSPTLNFHSNIKQMFLSCLICCKKRFFDFLQFSCFPFFPHLLSCFVCNALPNLVVFL